MIKSVKYILININILFLIFITSCSNKEITNIESDLRKINVIDHTGSIVKTYYEKYSSNYGRWLKLSCSYDVSFVVEENLDNLNNKCQFSNLTLVKINHLKNDNNEDKKSIKNLNNSFLEDKIKKEENSLKEEETEEEETEEEVNENTLPFIPGQETECTSLENC